MSDLGLLYLTHAGWFWAALGALLLAIEVASGSGWLLWPAASAGVVAVIEAFWEPPLAQAVLLFVVLLIVSTLTARRYFPRRRPEDLDQDINDNIARLVGHHGRVVGGFEQGAGRVFIDGKEWAAELEGGGRLEVGERIEVTGVSGARLKVRGA
jgi:inner membrane protein